MSDTTNTFGILKGNFKPTYPEVANFKKKRKWKILADLQKGASVPSGKPGKLPSFK